MSSIADPIAGSPVAEAKAEAKVAAAAPAITLPATGERELRLDLFRGLALWLIFIDHLPTNLLTWLTLRNYGFSDATEIFIFISGYTAAFVYGRAMLEGGFVIATARILRRVWQIYVAHVFLFTIFLAEISYVATSFENPLYSEEMGIMDFLKQPDVTIVQALLLRFRPVNMDVLPLYIALMLVYPLVLWAMLRKLNLTLAASFLLYLAARHFGWNLPAYPAGTWYFNPFAWQVLFVFGSWCAMGGARANMHIINSRYTLWFCIAYLVFALIMTMAGRFPEFGAMFPDWLYSTFNPNDKTNLAPYRFLHFVVITVLVIRFVPKDWSALEWKVFDPLIVCGQQSLAVFCVGVFLSFVGHFELSMSSGSLFAQIFVSISGIAIMTIVAYYISWSKRQDKPIKPPAPKPAAPAKAA